MSKKTYERSHNYRKNFFDNTPGLFGMDRWQCVYCGKILKKNKIQIDHLIPVNKVKHIGMGRLLMKTRKINNINSVKNLVPACEKCNKRKSDHMSGWIIKGTLGRHFSYWVCVWIFRLIVLCALIWLIYMFLSPDYQGFLSNKISGVIDRVIDA